MEQIKDELIDCIQKMTNDNLLVTKQRIDKLFQFIEVSSSLWGEVPTFVTTNEEVPEDLQVPEEFNPTIIEIPKTEGIQLDRKLKGGILKGDKADIYVPEKFIRMQGFVHGDWVEAIGANNKDLVFLKRKNSITEQESNRLELEYCLLSSSPDNLLIAEQHIVNGNIKRIKIDGETPYQFLISHNDVQDFGLKEGNVVSIAYHKSDFSSHRVVWLHHDFSDADIRPTPKPSGYYKEDAEKQSIWTDEEKTLLNGKKIVIVGADFRTADFKTLSKEGNFTLDSLSGDESKTRFKAKVRYTDLIISAGEHSSHRGSGLAKDCAKKFNIPFRAAPTSQSSIKKAIIHGTKEKQIPFYTFFK
ncbi:hypothetical protein [Sporosarcina sp. FSL K6-1508]|uniref:hypothetical protein n=1 Tax=Sporosarcina sp. FSL K6-1508 TaxID=2921553 RepID=UPI0030F50CEB